jgi:hypothetical protein
MIGWSVVTATTIPALPVMTLYRFNGPLYVPYYRIDGQRPGAQSGTLAQGTSVIPCLVIRNGQPVTDANGTPYVGFDIVVDAATADPKTATATFKQAVARQAALQVTDHHCSADVQRVLNIRDLYALEKAPFFDPPPQSGSPAATKTVDVLDEIVRTFHNSSYCTKANQRLLGRRQALADAWDQFIATAPSHWDQTTLARAKHVDYGLRTALYEGHLGRGCNAYGACERNIILLSLRNRAVGQCLSRQGCRFPGDIQGVASEPSQYNIWDAYLTQISGLTACYLRDDLATQSNYQRLQAMYTQTIGDAIAILYGGDAGLRQVFPNTALDSLTQLRHYYHPPAMGKCFPQESNIEYMSGAIAERDGHFALIANMRIKVGKRVGTGYQFREFQFTMNPERDDMTIVDRYPGFVVDGRKVTLKGGGGCTPYGVSPSCHFDRIGRYRTVPSWLKAGQPLAIQCQIKAQGESCTERSKPQNITVGGACDVDMMPVAGVH